MTSQLTVYQHYVPQHYLKLWKNSSGQVWCHDLHLNEKKERATKRILGDDYLYEKDLANPNNEIEIFLGSIENAAAPLLKKISELPLCTGKDAIVIQEAMCLQVAQILSSPADKSKLFDFISAQLVRTPRTVEEISKSIKGSTYPQEILAILTEQNEPFQLVKLGMKRLPQRLHEAYTLVLSYSIVEPFVTSDHPVLEVVADPNYLPQTVYNVLHKDDTFLAFPIGPHFQCLLFPKNQKNDVIKFFYQTVSSLPSRNGLDPTIKWRAMQPELLNMFRSFHTGFGRRFLISCQDESDLIEKSPLKPTS
ncbi:hypothetical protein JAB6_01130 [Janthinobacterium sp. HH104]|jgi:hypothetical protein|uniref:DUF4238 domain-containing protein n=1 Tax=unclassified Janthinobacterium TaxID=2610881 RepID=UPI000892AE99|nr:DUF4238 domain-containing protein [Janthinobacterium sp. HH104]OEZ89383.1 hypothetical protein JAB6_01130 [Janthinobacterium sp. HH104]